MPGASPLKLDVLVVGGGVAGLWLLGLLQRSGYNAWLCDRHGLGYPQTVGCQGIIHGGLKYTLKGVFTSSAQRIREMPGRWRRCLAGQAEPDLSATELRSDFCHLWRTDSLSSRFAMFGAANTLQVAPAELPRAQWPQPLRDCPGKVYRLDEQVMRPTSFLQAIAQPLTSRLLKVDAIDCAVDGGNVTTVRLACAGETIDVQPRHVVFAAGEANAALRDAVGLSTGVMQRRPLRLVMGRGELPALNGHCVDGKATRITVTTDRDRNGRTIWQLGGKLSEDGVALEPLALIAHAKREVAACIPGIDLRGVEWATWRVDRAEGLTPGSRRPDGPTMRVDGNVITAWPTKLALAPLLAEHIAEQLPPPGGQTVLPPTDWPRPVVAEPPWETEDAWIAD